MTKLYSHQNRWQDISDIYFTLVKEQPNNAIAHFNCAYYLNKAGQFTKAVLYYHKAMSLGISQDYEVSINIASIYSDQLAEPDKAIDILLTSIDKHPQQDALYYNLANIYEQLGNKGKALTYFELAFSKNANNYTALARQADINKVKTKDDAIIVKMKSALNLNHVKDSDKTNLAYALGKSHDDCGEYDLAFQFYQQANMLDQKSLPKYNPQDYERYIDNIINIFSKTWLENFEAPTSSLLNNAPLFICGMFRSGSTLCEQILAAHSQISIGGEQDFFHRTMLNHYPSYPLSVCEKFDQNKSLLLKTYETEIKKQQNEGEQLTDKRPDNFLYLGLIKALMPNAKIIWTKRAMLDNCLSVLFLRLGASMPYATKMENAIHFYQQQEKLMKHWKSIFGKDIYEFDYDKLIQSPKTNIENLLSFIRLPWEDGCKNFHKVDNQVKTASVWQVRQPLYKFASGRCSNYQKYLK